MSQLVQLEGKDTTQSAHCALVTVVNAEEIFLLKILVFSSHCKLAL